jgi:PKD repeat protein
MVYFSDLSSGDPTSWDWTFGDGGTSQQQHPSHEYTSVNTYTVSLTAANENGQDTETKVDYIDVTSSGGTCHVGAIDLVGLYKSTGPPSGRGYYADSTITVHDQDCQPLAGVTVDITWSGCISGSDSDVTDGSGQVVFSSPVDPDGGTFTCCVDSLSKYAYPYEPGSNHETCDSIQNP